MFHKDKPTEPYRRLCWPNYEVLLSAKCFLQAVVYINWKYTWLAKLDFIFVIKVSV